MKKRIIITAVFVLFSAGINAQVRDTIVKIFTISNTPNYYQPWQMVGQSSSSGSGCIIEGKKILTNAHVVSDVTFIQVRRNGETKRFTAKVAAIDHDVDLAVLSVEDESFFEGATALEIGETPEQGDTVQVYGFPMGGDKLSITKGVVSRVELSVYSHSMRSFLNVQIDAAINRGNSGGPLIKDGKVAGVAFQSFRDAENIGYTIPPLIINHFLEDIKDGKYRGFPSLGISWQELENDAHREKLGMKEDMTGIVINRVVYDSSAWGVLRENDVILSMDGIDIDNDGTVPFRMQDRINFAHVINTKYGGDTLKISVLRDKKKKDIKVRLKGREELIQSVIYDKKPEYYIFGGIVFTKLTGNFLREWGDVRKAPVELVKNYYHDIKTQDKQEVVILLQVLADDTNVGYHNFRAMPLENVNGKAVKDMNGLIEAVESNKEKYIVFEFSGKAKIVLEHEKSKKASLDILDRYMIPSDRSDNFVKAE
ncbi:MAG TPA: serine protease [Firmicutes bacterium]|nr:serine protease [Bacillota bacterium]